MRARPQRLLWVAAVALPLACRRPASLVVPLAPEVARAAPEGGTNLPGPRGVAHDRGGAPMMWRRGRNDERQRVTDLLAAHARLAVLDAEIEEERVRAR